MAKSAYMEPGKMHGEKGRMQQKPHAPPHRDERDMKKPEFGKGPTKSGKAAAMMKMLHGEK